MGIEDGTTEYKLKHQLEYRLKGQAEVAKFIVLKEPTMDHVKHYLKLKQMIMCAQMDLAKQASEINKLRDAMGTEVKPFSEDVQALESEADDMTEAISLSLQAAPNVDIGLFIETFEAMACMKARRAICVIDDVVPMTSALWDNLNPNDAFDMAVRWCAFFAMPSQGGEKTTSGQQLELHTARTEA